MGNFLFMHWVSTYAHWPPPSGARYRTLHFVQLTHGHVKNWSWTILADKSLVPLYRVYRQRSHLRWFALMTMLYHSAKAVFPSPLPPVHFNLRMVPSDQAYSTHCLSITRRVILLCYAFPFSTHLGKNESYWNADMVIASSYLSHEATLALLMDNRWGNFYQRRISKSLNSTTDEAIATLFNMEFALRFGSLDPQFKGYILPPLKYGLSHVQLTHMNDPDRWATIGSQIAGLTLEQTFGGLRSICMNNPRSLRSYRTLLTRVVRYPARLQALEQTAIRNLQQLFESPRVKIRTVQGVKHISVDILNHKTVKRGKVSLGGVIGVFLNTKGKPVKFSPRSQ